MVSVSVVLIALCGYITADAYDITPGVLTMRSPGPSASPYPTARAFIPPEVNGTKWDPQAPKADSATLQKAVDAYASSELLSGHASVKITDALTGETLASHDAETPRTPASNMKIVTAATALNSLGAGRTFTTEVRAEGENLYLVGGGDTLLAEGKGDPTAINGRAGLADLAEETASSLRNTGHTSVDLIVDSSLFQGPLRHEESVGINASYVMELRPIAVNQSRNESRAYQNEPDLRAAHSFAAALAERGVTVRTVVRGETSSSAVSVASVQSAPVSDVVSFMLTHSDNTSAEVLGHMMAIQEGEEASFAGAGRATLKQLKKLGVSTEGLVISDNSGLASSNKLTTVALTNLLSLVFQCEGCSLESLASGLPVGALSGTLKDRYTGTEAAGNVRAKTGTLVEATSLSGYVWTSHNRLLIFSVLSDGLPEGSFVQGRAHIDELIAAIAAS